MNDAVLIADKSRAQDVKLAVEALKKKGAVQAESVPKDHRPWGWVEGLLAGERFQVKRIVVQPGQSLSLQSHFHRSEHWIVVEGTAKVTVGDEVTLLRSEEHTSELQSLMRISYAVFCLKKKNKSIQYILT